MISIGRFLALGILLTLLSTCVPANVNSPEGAYITPRGFPITFFTQDISRCEPQAWPRRYGLKPFAENPISNFSYKKLLFNSIFWISLSLTLAYVIQVFRSSDALNHPLLFPIGSVNIQESKQSSTSLVLPKRKQNTKLILFYFLPTILLSVVNFESDLRRFDCPTRTEPYFGMSTDNYHNLDPTICNRRAFDKTRIPGRLVLLFISTPFFLLHVYVISRLQNKYKVKTMPLNNTSPTVGLGNYWRWIAASLALPICGLLLLVLYVPLVLIIENSIGLRHGCYWVGFCELLYLCFTVGTFLCVSSTVRSSEPLSGADSVLKLHIHQCFILYFLCVLLLTLLPLTQLKADSVVIMLLTVTAIPIVINLLTMIAALLVVRKRTKAL